MAASGRMSRVQAAYADGGSHHGVLGAKGWADEEVDREMYQMNPQYQQQQYAQHYTQEQQTPSAAQARWSQHYPAHPQQHGAAENQDGTPLRNSYQDREDVGPDFDQVQDPDLHEQYFGVADGGEGLTPRSRGLGLSGSQRNSRFVDEGERGSWQ